MKQRMLAASLIAVLAIGCGLIASYLPDVSLVIVSFFILIFSLFILHKYINVLNLRSLSIPAFFYFAFLALVFIPAHFVFFKVSDPFSATYLIAVSSVLLTFPLGVICASALFKYRPSETKIYSSTEVMKQEVDARLEPAFILCLLTSIVFVGLYVSEVKTLPMLYAISHPGSPELTMLREKSAKLLGSHFSYIYFWLKVMIFPILAVFSYGMYSIYKKKRWLIYFAVTLLIGTLYISLTFERAPVAMFYLFLFLFIFLLHRGHFTTRFLILALIAVAWFPILTIFLRTGLAPSASNLSMVVSGILYRFFYEKAYGLYQYFMIFPAHHDFLGGQGIRPLAILAGQEHFNIPNYVYLFLHPSGLESGSANTAFIGYYYADFGMLGVLLSSFVVGILLQSLQIYFVRNRKDILNFVVYAYLIYTCWHLCSTSITVLLWSWGVIIVLLFPWFMKLLGEIFTPKRQSLAQDN